jgi:hypothetical protein
MLFKVKKFLLPTLISISKHIKYDYFIKKVFTIFEKFTTDDIWGVRKVCMEHLKSIIETLKPDETKRLIVCIEFMKKCMADTSKWVKNCSY